MKDWEKKILHRLQQQSFLLHKCIRTFLLSFPSIQCQFRDVQSRASEPSKGESGRSFFEETRDRKRPWRFLSKWKKGMREECLQEIGERKKSFFSSSFSLLFFLDLILSLCWTLSGIPFLIYFFSFLSLPLNPWRFNSSMAGGGQERWARFWNEILSPLSHTASLLYCTYRKSENIHSQPLSLRPEKAYTVL